MKVFTLTAIVLLIAGIAAARSRTIRYDDVSLTVDSVGPTTEDVARETSRAERSREVRRILSGTSYRVVNFQYVYNETDSQNDPSGFDVHFYDYTNDRVVIARGQFGSRRAFLVRVERFDPGAASTELADAENIVRSDRRIETAYGGDAVRITDAMPRVSNLNGVRLINVGLEYPDGTREIVGISFKNRSIVRYENGAPPSSAAATGPTSCGTPDANQTVTFNGTPGSYNLVVTQGPTTLWTMTVVRPSASSGNPAERSGIEVQSVTYRGKSVMKRGHAPILNVKYDGNTCGPYRDWQYEEGMFNAPSEGAVDPADGIRMLAAGQIATTQVDTTDDTGNFQGVAIYRQGTETVLVSEMEAGWYRYIMEWRFDDDGTIRPRYGFGAVQNSCVCFTHYHHVYWRFDLDVVNAANDVYQREGGRSSQFLTTEAAVLRNHGYRQYRHFFIKNSTGPEAYTFRPNLSDGFWNADGTGFGSGDLWILRFAGTVVSPTEIDDPNPLNDDAPAALGSWVNGGAINGQDIVLWYGAHFTHSNDGASFNPDHRYPDTLSGDHVVGPDLIPVNW